MGKKRINRVTMHRFCTAAVLMAVFSNLLACGYQFQGSGSILPPDVKKIAIAPVENDTTEPGLGLRLQDELRTRFERYGVVEIVEDTSAADAVLEARIVNVDTKVQNVTSNTDVALDEDLFMTVSAELRRKNGQVLYRDPTITTTESFASVSNVVVTSSSDFAQGGIAAADLDALSQQSQREVSRGQQQASLDALVEETARQIYLNAVASQF